MKTDIQIQRTLSNLVVHVGRYEVKLTHIHIMHYGMLEKIQCEVLSSGILNQQEKQRLKDAILKRIHKQAEVIVAFKYKL